MIVISIIIIIANNINDLVIMVLKLISRHVYKGLPQLSQFS